jgi:hypothetical protein
MRLMRRIAPPVITLLAVAFLMLVPSLRAAAAGTPPITVPFDHLSTGFELDGVHRDLPCESCHLNAVFKGTPRNCGICHTTGSTFNATPKTPTHIRSTNNCAACHDTISFRPGVHFDHREVMGSCVSCHNGTIAQGEGSTHPKTSNACEACHTVMSWNPPKAVDHTQIPMAVAGFCIICHNGVQAGGKSAGHIATNLECGDCHLTTTWVGATFDHTGILNNCLSCHNGVKAVGKQGNHMPTSNLCENCHTTGIGTKAPNWVPSKFDHTQAANPNTCLPCHSGSEKISTGFVSGQPANHVPLNSSTIDCVTCHANNPTAETWSAIAATIATLHTGLNVTNCVLCHGGETFAGVPVPYIPMSISGVSPTKKAPLAPPHIPILVGTDCSACHGLAYTAGGFGPATAMSAAKHGFVSATCATCHDTGRSFYVGSGTPLQLRPADHLSSSDPRMTTGDCSLCHETKDWNSTAMPAGHMPNPANQACTVCHKTAPNDYTPTTLAANSVLHTGIAGNCGLCHGNNVTALTWANNFTPKDALLTPSHIPYLAGTDCSSCHSSATYAIGGFGPTNMSAAKHAFVPTTCNTCHEAGLSFYLGASTPTLQGRPTDHLSSGNAQQASGDCSACHNTTNWTTTALPSGHMPNPGNQGCTVCHTAAPANYATLASIAVLHTGISTGCTQCHGSTTQLTFYNNNDNPKAAVLTPPHIPSFSGTDCSSCHAANYVTGGFGPMNMTQAKHAFVPTTCITCHEAGLSFYMGAASPALQGRPADHNSGTMKTSDCGSCHTTANWNSGTLPAGHMPNPGNQGCNVCHIAAPTNYTTMAANTVLHTGISSGCITCHGQTQLSFYNNNDPPKPMISGHIPSGATPCEDCHTGFTSFVLASPQMSSAKHTLMFGYVSATNCDACHEIGRSFPGVIGLTVRPSPGHQGGGDCSGSSCHNTNNWSPKGGGAKKVVATASTRSTIGTVVSAPAATQNAAIATAATATRGVATPGVATPGASLPSRANGAAALRGIGVAGSMGTAAPLSHAGITTNCVSCHNGTLAAGKGATHIASNNSCENCHTTFAWMPARFEHRGVTASCASCHNGISAPSKPTRHVQTTQDCSACHGTIAWAPATFSHVGINATCQSCHNGIVATAKQVQHVTTTLDCGSCHNTMNWTVVTPRSPLKPLIPSPTKSPHPIPHDTIDGSNK